MVLSLCSLLLVCLPLHSSCSNVHVGVNVDIDIAAKNCVSCQSDRIHSLPGWNQPLPSPWYSGLLTYNFQERIVHTHYVLVLAEDINDKNIDDNSDNSNSNNNNKPLIYWSNGGPGASSMFGLFTELGPLLLNDESLTTAGYSKTGIPSLLYNEFAWTRLGHVLIFDQPAPVGFSYCQPNNSTTTTTTTTTNNNDTQQNTTRMMEDCAGLGWTDELAAQNTFAALQAFYQKFPNLQSLNLYLTGESYAGIYIPTLAREILNYNNNSSSSSSSRSSSSIIPLQGFAVGDGCLGTETGICKILDANNEFDFWFLLFLAGHNQIPLHTFLELLRACRPLLEEQQNYFLWHHSSTISTNTKKDDICKAAVQKARQQAGGVYAYALYDECTYRNGVMMTTEKTMMPQKFLVGGALNDYPCGGDIVLKQWLQLDTVKHALHVDGLDYFSADNANGFDYTPTEKDLTGFYRSVALNTNLRVLVYNGDTDPAITSFATQNWTRHLNLEELQEWRPWTVDGCQYMGGYVTRYQGNMDFLTIRGAGHMVPTHKPLASFVFLQAWLQNQDYPPFVASANCSSSTSTTITTTAETRSLMLTAAMATKIKDSES